MAGPRLLGRTVAALAVLLALLCVFAHAEDGWYNEKPGKCVRHFDVPEAPPPPGFMEDALDEFKRRVRSAFENGGGATGFACRVMLGHHVLAEMSLGVVNKTTHTAVTLDTPFRVMSITKLVTTWTALALRDRGLARIDAPAWTYMRELKAVHNRFSPGAPPDFTMADLSMHTAGLPRSPPCSDDDDSALAALSCNTTYAPVVERWGRAGGPLFRPNERAQYSNFGMALLGYVMACSQGASAERARDAYVELATSLVLEPLGMTSTGFNYSDPDTVARIARAYDQHGAPIIKKPPTFELPSHGMYASVRDLSKLLASLSNKSAPVVSASCGVPVRGASVLEATRGSFHWQSSGGAYVANGMGWDVMTAPLDDPSFGPIVSKFGQKRNTFAAFIGALPALNLGVTAAMTFGPVPDNATEPPLALETVQTYLGNILAPAAEQALMALQPFPVPPPSSFDAPTFMGKYFMHPIDGGVPLGPITISLSPDGGILATLPSFIPLPDGLGAGPYPLSYSSIVLTDRVGDGSSKSTAQVERFVFDMWTSSQCTNAAVPAMTVLLLQQDECVGLLVPDYPTTIGLLASSPASCLSVITW